MKKYLLIVLLACVVVCSLKLNAQETKPVISIGEQQTITSSILSESRDVLIYAPQRQGQKLPLVIVFDGEALFETVVSALRFMNSYSEIPQMPEAIVIAIKNVDRNRDMPIPQQYGGEKGEDNFQKFIKDELIPWANKKYSLNGHTISVGHSQGGYFVSWLLTTSTENFPWIIALDAPMNVSPNSIPLKAAIKKLVASDNKIRYVSIEAAYGWGEEWMKYFSNTNKAMSKKTTGESHESMAFIGVYEGLKYLYTDFAPPRKDMNLSELRDHYQSVSKKYGYDYEIPLQILTASASRKMVENRKNEIIELLDYADARYGVNERSKELRAKAAGLVNATNSVVDSFLALPVPSPGQIKNYIGIWSGQFISKEGKVFPCEIEISLESGKAKLLTAFDPHSPATKEEPDVFHVNKENKLVFGKRNRGGGIIINTLRLDKKGNLTGEGLWLGFTIPSDAPADVKKQLNFLVTTATKFNLTKQ